jgi:hypothetical protein
MVYCWQPSAHCFFTHTLVVTGTALFFRFWLIFEQKENRADVACEVTHSFLSSPIYNWCAQLHAAAKIIFETVRKTSVGILRRK